MISSLTALALLTLPGQWLALAPPLRGAGLAARIALGVALTPLCTSLGTLALRAAGLDFEQAARVLLGVALAAVLPLAIRARGATRPSRATWIGAAITGGILLACVALPWWLWTSLREFSWHGLMHTDFCYAVARAAHTPEDPNVAGVGLRYYWLAHVHYAVAAWASGWSPTRVYLLANAATLLACAVLCACTSRLLGASRPAAALGSVLLLLGTNALGLAARAALGSEVVGRLGVFGDFRYTPFLAKFAFFSAMPLGLALLVSVGWLAVAVLRRQLVAGPELGGLALLATGLLYPPLLPTVAVLLAALALALSGRRAERLRLGLWIAAALAASGAWLRLLTGSGGQGAIELAHPAASLIRTLHLVLIAFGPLLPLVVPGVARIVRRRDPAAAPLLLLALGSAVGYAMLRLPDGIEYKLVFGTTAGLAPFAAVAASGWLRRFGPAAWAVAPAVACALGAVWLTSLGRHLPSSLEGAPGVVSSRFYVALRSDEADRGWTDAVRERTPPDAVLVHAGSAHKVTALTGRAAYLARASGPRRVAGFHMPFERYFAQRGLEAEAAARGRALDALYAAREGPALRAAIAALRLPAGISAPRPLALHVDPARHAALDRWLGESGDAHEIFRDPHNAVWLVRGRSSDFTSREPARPEGARGRRPRGM